MGFFKWFKNGAKMKRWILVILLGVILACYGIAEIMVLKEISFFEVGKIIATFVLGFVTIIIGLIYSQKRVLELLVEDTDTRIEKNNKKISSKSLIFNKKVYDEGPKIVVIGGGTGLNTVLRGLKEYSNNVTAIVTVSEYGKKASKARKELNLLPLEDIKQSMISLAYDEKLMEQLLNTKMKELTFGDIYFASIRNLYGDFSKAISMSRNVLNIIGTVLPVSLDEMEICAELENGMVVQEKDKIPEVVYDKVTKISRIFISTSNCLPAPGVIEAIQTADAIIIGPGSLYTNVIPNLLVKNIARTIRDSKAMKIYVSNIMTEPGQTDNYGISDHINAIIEHAGEGIIDYCICDTGEVIPEFVKRYNKSGSDLVEQDTVKVKTKGVKLIPKNLSTIINEKIRHNPKAIAQAIIEIICDDMKYQDKVNDPEYLRINSRLKERRKINKVEAKHLRKEEK